MGGGAPSSYITGAIDNAVNNGRVVLFATGNTNTFESYPSTLPNVVAVGATSMCDERKSPSSCDGETNWGSNYGTALDVTAPGVQIYTTDISGSGGYNPGDYRADWHGTSSACPNAAGVVALMLAVNPQLTPLQVYDILTSTADKVGGYTYTNGRNNELGYGRVNACRAVWSAVSSTLYIYGPGLVCTSATFQVPNTGGAPVTWSSSNPNGLSINPSTGVATRVNNYTGPITISATVNSNSCTAAIPLSPISVWVGVPDPNNSSNVYELSQPGANPVTLYVSTTYGFSMGSVQGASSYTWQIPRTGGWSFTNGATGLPNYINTGSVAGPYQLTCKPGNACGIGGIRALYINLVSGGGGQMMVANPNPVDNVLQVPLDPAVDIDAQIDLINSNLEVVFSTRVTAKETSIDTKALQAGLYLLKVSTGSELRTSQIVVKH